MGCQLKTSRLVQILIWKFTRNRHHVMLYLSTAVAEYWHRYEFEDRQLVSKWLVWTSYHKYCYYDLDIIIRSKSKSVVTRYPILIDQQTQSISWMEAIHLFLRSDWLNLHVYVARQNNQNKADVLERLTTEGTLLQFSSDSVSPAYCSPVSFVSIPLMCKHWLYAGRQINAIHWYGSVGHWGLKYNNCIRKRKVGENKLTSSDV